jgi:biotin operon repressor
MKKKLNWKNVVNSRNKEILRLQKKGYSYADIGVKVGISRQLAWAVINSLRKHGLDK